jgi:hypothetical protein
MHARNTKFQVRSVNRRVRDLMSSIIPTELLWLASGCIMLLAAFLASAAE